MREPTRSESVAVDAALGQARAALQQQNHATAEAWCRQALQLADNSAAAWLLLGVALRPRDSVAAEAALTRAIALDGGSRDAHFHLGNLHREQQRYARAIAAYERALQLAPNHPSLLNNLGLALAADGQDDAAERAYATVLARDAQHRQARTNLVHLLCRQQRHAEAHAHAVEYLRHHRNVEAPATFWIDHGIGLHHLHDLTGAVVSFQRALAIDPGDTVALTNLGSVLIDAGDFTGAAPALAAAHAAAPEDLNAQALLAHCRQHLCAWRGLADLHAIIRARLDFDPAAGINPFFGLAMPMSPALQRQNARHWASGLASPPSALPAALPVIKTRGNKLRLGYVSSDFRAHALSFLALEVWERHDSAQLSTFAYAIGPPDDSSVRTRIRNAFGTFRECHADDSGRIAEQIKNDGIDVLVDLNGYTTHARSEIFVNRPAPVQAQWLGYLGTLGAPWMDYIVTDRYATPPDAQADFDERFLYLPDCYCPSDTRRGAAAAVPTREACGLPRRGMVFCCFNNPYKLLPAVFDIWMRLLHGVPDSVLWLSPSNRVAITNLQREAVARGVDAARLVFAPQVPIDQHLVRHIHADLYLDTFPYNAGTAANDALFMGVPVLTCSGETMASRVAGSQLRAIGLPRLITTDLRDYEAGALALAHEDGALEGLKAMLARNRTEAPLFDMARFTSNLERALVAAANGNARA